MDIDQLITTELRRQESIARALHEPSGRLSASILYKPLLEQVLKILGVPEKPFDDYALRLFARGKQVEEWVCSMLPGEEQKEVSYRNVVGVVDKLHEGQVIEVKSVKRSQWRWLKKEGVKWSHALQATLYALALEKTEFTVTYACADDFETMSFTHNVDNYKDDVDRIISEVANALKSGVLPEFKARETWQEKPEYASRYSTFPDWVGLSVEDMMLKLERQYPDALKKLKGVVDEKITSVR